MQTTSKIHIQDIEHTAKIVRILQVADSMGRVTLLLEDSKPATHTIYKTQPGESRAEFKGEFLGAYAGDFYWLLPGQDKPTKAVGK